jgi:nitroreductase
MTFPVQETIKTRHSVRTYNGVSPSEDDRSRILSYADTSQNPFGVPVTFRFLEKTDELSSEKLGTYGVIKGTKLYLGATVPDGRFALEALGYEFERLILYATSLGLGTCWLAGTFNRSGFAATMGVKDDELFPAVSAIGYSAEKRSMTEAIFRKALRSDHRKPWDQIFYDNNFESPLSKESAGEYADALEMLRLSPSATNKQPWRVVRSNQIYHFYEDKTPGYGEKLSFDLQLVDVGISACHFVLTAQEMGLTGNIVDHEDSSITKPQNTHYRFSWVPE